jgi:hypothetical protein
MAHAETHPPEDTGRVVKEQEELPAEVVRELEDLSQRSGIPADILRDVLALGKVSPELVRQMKELEERTGTPFPEVLRDVLALGKLYYDAKSRGDRMMVEQGGKVRQIILKHPA